jgi:hypothetical protein
VGDIKEDRKRIRFKNREGDGNYVWKGSSLAFSFAK